MHVLPTVHSTTYCQILGDGEDLEGRTRVEGEEDHILDGCRCARCGSPDLKLMNSWVERWFWGPRETCRLKVRLARCQKCKARERILPFDAFPGKQVGVDVVFACIEEVQNRPGVTFVQLVSDLIEKGIEVSRQLLAHWLAGVRARGEDLFQLLRHRAIQAPKDCAGTRRLVSFSRFRETARESGFVRSEVGPKDGLSLVLETSRAFIDVECLVRFGAEKFRQAVLLFRCPQPG